MNGPAAAQLQKEVKELKYLSAKGGGQRMEAYLKQLFNKTKRSVREDINDLIQADEAYEALYKIINILEQAEPIIKAQQRFAWTGIKYTE